MILNGQSNSGKTYSLVQKMLDEEYGFFNIYKPHSIYIINPNYKFDDSFKPLLDKLKKSELFDEDQQILTDVKQMDTFLDNIIQFQNELR